MKLAIATAESLPVAAALERVLRHLVSNSQIDERELERARRVAAASGQRIDAVLGQLGLVSDRELAGALAAR